MTLERAESTSRLDRFFLSALLPLTAFLALTYGFAPFYSRNAFVPGAFQSSYHGGIYRYRVLGRELVEAAHRLLAGAGLDSFPVPFASLAPGFSPALFLAHALVNGLCFAGFCAVAFALLRGRAGERAALPVYLVLLLLVGLTFYVVTPYDALSYLLLVLAVAAFHSAGPLAFVGVLLWTVLGALTRETAAVGLAYMFAVATLTPGAARRPLLAKFGLALAGFVVTYVGLRLFYGAGQGFLQEITLEYNLSVEGVLGLALMGLMVWAVETVCRAAGLIGAPDYPRALERFYAASVPYLLTVFLGGFFFEIRLAAPLVILHALLAAHRHGGANVSQQPTGEGRGSAR